MAPYMVVISIILATLSTLVALGNWYGIARCSRDRARGNDRSFSCIPLFSLLFGAMAWLAGRHTLGWWVLLPAALDPINWALPLLPWILWRDSRQNSAK
jgi:hypothetical protein